MKIRVFYNRLLSRLSKMDLEKEEALEIYRRTNALMIDVRTPEEYAENHFNGAINIPLYEIDNIANEIVDKNKVILVYCKIGSRSKLAKEILCKNGYKNVYTFNAKI